MNRICPTEETLAEYISGLLSEEERSAVEEHLAKCKNCRTLALEAHTVISTPDAGRIKRKIRDYLRKNTWMIASAIFLLCSFIFRKYFLQFLALTVISALKWIIDSRNTKMLIMIHDAWKHGDKQKTNRILSKFDPEK
jgi:hypothetical protein